MQAFEEIWTPVSPAECRMEKIGMQRYDDGGRTWVHLLNYQYDEKADRVLPVERLELTLRNVAGGPPKILVPDGGPAPACELSLEDRITRIVLRDVRLYTVLCFG